MTNLDSILKSKDIILLTKVHMVKAMLFPVFMFRCESWTIRKPEYWRIDIFKLWCWRRLLSVPWTARRSNQSTLKEINPENSLGMTDAEAEAPIFWPPNAKNWLIGKDPEAGRDWGQEEKGTTEDEMAGWHHWFNGHEFEETPGDGDGQGGLECCSPWGHKELDMTEQPNNNSKNHRLSRMHILFRCTLNMYQGTYTMFWTMSLDKDSRIQATQIMFFDLSRMKLEVIHTKISGKPLKYFGNYIRHLNNYRLKEEIKTETRKC